jgi:hypothetical protein
MKVERGSSSRPVRSVAQAAYARRIEAADSVANVDAVLPTAASVLGIPEAEFTPKVRNAIMGLMGEVDSLRQELAQTKARLSDVEKAADQDGMLPPMAMPPATPCWRISPTSCRRMCAAATASAGWAAMSSGYCCPTPIRRKP